MTPRRARVATKERTYTAKKVYTLDKKGVVPRKAEGKIRWKSSGASKANIWPKKGKILGGETASPKSWLLT